MAERGFAPPGKPLPLLRPLPRPRRRGALVLGTTVSWDRREAPLVEVVLLEMIPGERKAAAAAALKRSPGGGLIDGSR